MASFEKHYYSLTGRLALGLHKKTSLLLSFKKIRSWFRGRLIPIKPEAVTKTLIEAWKDPRIPQAQGDLVARELREMYTGTVIGPFTALAEALKATGCESGEIIEVGCASGYYVEVLQHLLGHEIRYRGIDYSEAMIAEARRKYPTFSFQVSDASDLQIPDNSCDVLISGCVLLHVPDYCRVIAESTRVSRRWVIFHRTPITTDKTQYFRKKAYGVSCVELHFGREEFMAVCESYGLRHVREFEISRGANGYMITYLFEKVNQSDLSIPQEFTT